MVKMRLRIDEPIDQAIRRFRKLVERAGLKKEMRRRKVYEKPGDSRRRIRLRAERQARKLLG